MKRVIHFEFSADDPDRAVTFYSQVFGWKTMKWNGPEDYWLITTGPQNEPGIDGAISRRSPFSGPTTVTMDVTSVDEFVNKIIAAGGQVVAPKMAIPGVGYFAYCKDTEGNVFGIMENNPQAQ
ncbi:MAG: VOC family protein [Candidatus Atribacteria bacterium]|nr:VOC family protein [Candidatus Atribacteria bacterium]